MKATSINKTRFFFAAALVLCGRIGAPTSAETITFQFTGELDADGGLAQVFSGTYSFESTQPDQDPDGGIGFYSLQSLSLDAGFAIFEPPTGEIYLENDIRGFFPHDLYTVTAAGTTPTGVIVNTIEISLIDELSGFLSGDELPATPPDITQADINFFTADIEMPDGMQMIVTGYLTSLTLVAPALCSPDLDGDGVVNAADLATLLGAWGPCVGDFCPADLDQDDDVDAADLATLLGAWGPCEEE